MYQVLLICFQDTICQTYLPIAYTPNVRTSPLKGSVVQELFQVASTSGQTLCGKEETLNGLFPFLPLPVSLFRLQSACPDLAVAYLGLS